MADPEDPKFGIINLRGANYRKLIVPEGLTFKCDETREQYREDEDEPGELDDQMTYEGNEYVLRLPVPAVFHKFIIGSRGKRKQEIEAESRARIHIPGKDEASDDIILRGREKQAIYSAKAQIDLDCEKAEETLEWTHFLSIPLATNTKFRQRVEQFKEDIALRRLDIDAAWFMPSRRMHFTICMLKLHSHAQVEQMKQCLAEWSVMISEKAVFRQAIPAAMRGLHILTDDTSDVNVVYTTDKSSALQNRMNNMADSLFAMLKKQGLTTEASLMKQRAVASDGVQAEVKLHATLINTKYGRNRRDAGFSSERASFDASQLLQMFGQEDFGTVPLQEMQLSCLDEMGNDGYYRSLYSVPLFKP